MQGVSEERNRDVRRKKETGGKEETKDGSNDRTTSWIRVLFQEVLLRNGSC